MYSNEAEIANPEITLKYVYINQENKGFFNVVYVWGEGYKQLLALLYASESTLLIIVYSACAQRGCL